MLKTVKFGGSSLADANQFRKAAAIIGKDASRRYVVVSAPGKRFDGDIKITDLLYACYEAARAGRDFSPSFNQICARYSEIAAELKLNIDLSGEFEGVRAGLLNDPSRDYAASRGEYLSAVLMAAYLDVPMIDAAECIRFTPAGTLDAERTQKMLSERLRALPRAVVPGFYGSMPDGQVRTFSRGGSDVTGALVARASGSDLYENWTDVSGMMCCDPRIVDNPKIIENLSYLELRELSYMGATVLHESAVFPVRMAGIPINIRNTNDPDAPGTMIHPGSDYWSGMPITGIAGRKDFASIMIQKDEMRENSGFALRVLQVLERYGVQMEHMPSGIDIMSVIVSSDKLMPHLQDILQDLQEVTNADSISVKLNMALLTVVGRGMKNALGAAGRVFSTLGRAGVNVEMIDQGSGELNLIIGIAARDFENAVRFLYREFFGNEN